MNKVEGKIYKILVSPIYQKAIVENCPHRMWNDLCIAYAIKSANSRYGLGFISYALMEDMKTTEEELYIVSETGKIFINGLTETMHEIDNEYTVNENETVFVATNEMKYFGAGVILNNAFFSNKVIEDYYIIPSSVHEVLLIKKGEMDPEYLKETVKNVNKTTVKFNERLSDTIYYYDAKHRIITQL